MRVLFTVIPEKTTFLQMVPLAWALRAAGHEVVVASAPGFADTITRAGLTAAPVGRDSSVWRIDGLDPDALELSRDGLPLPWSVVQHPDTPWESLRQGQSDAVVQGHKPENFPIIAGTVEFARKWEPDLVIWEPLSYVGAIAATACGAAHARMLWSIDVLGVTRQHYRRIAGEQAEADRADPLAEWLGGYARKYEAEFGEHLTTGDFTIDQMPGSVRMGADDVHYEPIRYIPYGGPAVVPRWLQRPAERTRVALTLGTTSTDRFAGYSFSVADALEAMADLDVEVVATIADTERQRIGRIPDNVRVVPFVSLDALAPTCAVAVNHCGPGTYLTLARHGVPQLHVPWDFDEPELARRAARTGGSITLHGAEISGRVIRDHVEWLLDEQDFRVACAELREEINAMPTPRDLVDRLEQLAADYSR